MMINWSYIFSIHRKYKLRKGAASFKITTLEAKNSLSVGDVLRDLYRMNLIHNSFILCSTNVVSNMNLKKALDQHTRRQAKDSNQILTLVLMEASHGHRIENRAEEACYFMHPQTNQILHHHCAPKHGSKKQFPVPVEIFDTSSEVEMRSDLVDTQIAICSKGVPQFFEDNFDYQTVRQDFVKGILHSDIYMETIYAHILQSTRDKDGNYGAGVVGTSAYDAISRDMISRWIYPICPDSNILADTRYSYNIGSVYKDTKVILARQCQVGNHVVLGRETEMNTGSRIWASVCGDNCFIDSDTSVVDSYLFSNVKVGKNCKIKHSIIGNDVKILDNVNIGRGCMIGEKVILGPNVAIPPFAKIGITKKSVVKDDDFYGSPINSDISSPGNKDTLSTSSAGYDKTLVGEQGVGYSWGMTVRDDSNDDGNDSDSSAGEWDDDDTESLNACLHYMAVREADIGIKQIFVDDPPSDDEGMSDDDPDAQRGYVDKNDIPIQKLSISGKNKEKEKQLGYQTEAIETLNRAHDQNHDLSTALLEFNALRMVYDATPEAQRRVLMKWFTQRIDWNSPNESISSFISRWKGLFGPVSDTDEAQIDLVWAIEEACAEASGQRSADAVRTAFQFFVRHFFESDIVDEDAITDWYETAGERSNNTKIDDVLILSLKDLVDYLQESSDEDDEEDDDSEDESDK